MARIDRITNERKSIRPEAPAAEKPYPLELGHADACSRPTTRPRSTSGPTSSSSPPTAATRGRRSAPTSRSAIDRDTVELMGVKGKDIKIAKNDGVEHYGTLFTIAESRAQAGLLWTGSDDGQVHVIARRGRHLDQRDGEDPRRAEARLRLQGGAVEVRRGHRLRHLRRPSHRRLRHLRLRRAPTSAQSWKSIAGDLPKGEVVRTITEDQKNADVLYLGTETGLWVSTEPRADLGPGAGQPARPCRSTRSPCIPRDNDMILATHGRAIWILDDLTPFQQYAKAQAADGCVFAGQGRRRSRLPTPTGAQFEGDMLFLGENPPLAAFVTYALKSKPDSVRIVIKDAAAARWCASSRATPRRRHGRPPASTSRPLGPAGGAAAGGQGRARSRSAGPRVLPGELRRDGVRQRQGDRHRPTSAVRADPESQISAADRRPISTILKELQPLNGRLTAAVVRREQVNTQLAAIRKALGDTTKVPGGGRADDRHADHGSSRRSRRSSSSWRRASSSTSRRAGAARWCRTSSAGWPTTSLAS